MTMQGCYCCRNFAIFSLQCLELTLIILEQGPQCLIVSNEQIFEDFDAAKFLKKFVSHSLALSLKNLFSEYLLDRELHYVAIISSQSWFTRFEEIAIIQSK